MSSSFSPPHLILLVASAALAGADTLTLESDRDNTLYQSPTGSLSNGSGERLFAGVTNGGTLRRTVLHFDVSGLPPGSVISSVTLDMYISKVPLLAPSTLFKVHRVTQPWGEGASDALMEEGTGAPSEADDATWIHTFYSGSFWTTAGGDFALNSSAATPSGVGLGPISWSSFGLAADVQKWFDQPSENFGWLIKASDELVAANAKRFDSREYLPDPMRRPRLTIVYDQPADFQPTALCSRVFCTGNSANVAEIEIDTCSCSAGSMRVSLSGAPANRLCYLLVGAGMGRITDPPGASGDLCLGGAAIGRYHLDAGITDASGSFSTDLMQANTGGGAGNLPSPPGGNLCSMIGQSLSFQYWYRNGAAPVGFSKALRVTLQ